MKKTIHKKMFKQQLKKNNSNKKTYFYKKKINHLIYNQNINNNRLLNVHQEIKKNK